MELMTSGAFAQASGLSRKALRLYDELGLLHPARVDPETLYRFYDPGQLEQARLVAWLRRLGMPLAVIRSVSGLPPAQAAEELAAYWATVEAETAARRELAIFLMGYLSGKDPGKDTAMSDGQGTLTVRYGVRSDIGLHREDNEDAAYAGPGCSRWPTGWAATRPARWPARPSSRRCGRWTPRCRPANC